MKMTRNALFELDASLTSVQDLQGVKFAYAVAKNRRKIKEEIDTAKEAIKPSESFAEFEKNRNELCKEHSKKNENGLPIIKNGKYDIEDIQKFESEFNTLKDKYKDTISEREKQVDEYNNLMKEEVNIDIYKVKEDDLPNNITPKQLQGIMDLVE